MEKDISKLISDIIIDIVENREDWTYEQMEGLQPFGLSGQCVLYKIFKHRQFWFSIDDHNQSVTLSLNSSDIELTSDERSEIYNIIEFITDAPISFKRKIPRDIKSMSLTDYLELKEY